MIYNKFSRRYFLAGSGASLMLPFLPSIMDRSYAAGEPAPRYVQLQSHHSVYKQCFFPQSEAGMTMVQNGITAKKLSSISGPMSMAFGTNFDSLRNKISLVRGLSLPGYKDPGTAFNHNTCASTTFSGATGNIANPVFNWSVDAVLAQSNLIYPNPVGKYRLVETHPAGTYGHFEYKGSTFEGKNTFTNPIEGTNVLLSLFTQLTGTQTPTPVADPTKTRKVDVLNAVFADYKQVSNSGKLSTEDKNKFENYLSLIGDIQKELAATGTGGGPAACNKPTVADENTGDAVAKCTARTKNAINILVAAMACELTRSVNLIFGEPYDAPHAWSHDGWNNLTIRNLHNQMIVRHGTYVSYLLEQMNSFQELGGTLLDNSLVYWGNEFGENQPGYGQDLNGSVYYNPHSLKDMPVMLAGGAAGKITMGEYINYQPGNGRPYNNLAISIFNAFGLNSSQYQKNGVIGFGEYNPTMVAAHGFQAYVTNAERVKPLPYLYKGTALG
jgi:hypothetical protein